MDSDKKRRIPIFAYIFLGLLLLGIAVYLTASLNSEFADFWTRYPGAFVRALLAHLTNIFPFSIAEVALLLPSVDPIARASFIDVSL